MKALILCGGLGTRLGELTKNTPKPMLTVGRYPILEHLVFHLYQNQVSQIIINLHHKPQVFMDYFKSRLLYSYEPELLGEEGTIQSLKHWLMNDYTVIMNGDTLTDIDILKMFTYSNGRNIRSMDGSTYTGTKIISPQYFLGDTSFTDYYDSFMYWQDTGTPSGLEKARKRYGVPYSEKNNKN